MGWSQESEFSRQNPPSLTLWRTGVVGRIKRAWGPGRQTGGTPVPPGIDGKRRAEGELGNYDRKWEHRSTGRDACAAKRWGTKARRSCGSPRHRMSGQRAALPSGGEFGA